MSVQLLQPRARLRFHGRSDERLVAAMRQGDERAFEAIYDRYHQPLLGFCRHMLGSHEEGEDALQHVFVAAHRHLSRDTAPVHLKAWLYAIARNRCTSMLRARREVQAMDDVLEPSTDGLAVAGEVERREELKELLGDLARLPEDQRAALVLAEIGDLSHDEIGAALAVRKDKVKALIFQAREALAGWREARGADCHEIQEQLATLRGSALRRAPIQRHVALCPTCAAFEREVARQRAAMALIAPVVPSLALKHTILSAAFSGGGEAAAAAGAAGAAGATAAGLSGTTAATGMTAKALTVAALAIGTGGAGAIAVREIDPPTPPAARTAAPARPATGFSTVTPARAKAITAALVPSLAEHGTAAGHTAAAGRSAIAPGQTKTKAHGRPADPRTAGRDRRAQGHGTLKPKHTGPPAHARKPAAPPRSSRAQVKQAPVPRSNPVVPQTRARVVKPPVVAPVPKVQPVKPPTAATPKAAAPEAVTPTVHGPKG